MKKLLIISLLFAFCKIQATTYYVRTDGHNAASGLNNTNNATTGAWLTHVYAFAHVSSGDSIVTIQGTYTETAQLVLIPGVSWHGLDSATCIIKSTITTKYIEMVNMRSAENTNGNQTISGLKFDGQNTTFSFFRIGGRSNVSIHDCSFADPQIYGVTFAVHNADDFDPGFPTHYDTSNKFYNNTMYNCGNWDADVTAGYGALQIGGQKDMLIFNNSIIQNNTCYNNGWNIKYWQGGYNVGTKIHDNYFKAKAECFTLGDQNWDFSIEMFNATGMEINNNTIINGCVDYNFNSTVGFGLGGSLIVGPYAYSLWIHDNTFYMESANTHIQTGITLEYSIDSVFIENNTFDKYNIGILYTPRPASTVSNVFVHNNLFTDVTLAEGAEGYFIDHRVYSGTNLTFNNLEYYNNTFLASSSNPVLYGIALPNSTSGGTLSNIKIKNNIIKGSINAPIQVLEGTVAITNLDIEYNDIYGCGNSNLPSYTVSPGAGYTFANNLNILPEFGGSNYSLVNTSALIDAGVNVGLPFTGTAPNINWVETTAPAPPTVNAGPDQIITIPATVTLTGTVTAGSGASIVSTVWTQLTGTVGTLNTPTSTTTTFTGLATTSSFRLTATDNFGAITTDDVIIVVANPGGCPVLDPTHKGTGVTLSGGGLVANINNGTVLGTIPMIGQKYFEVTVGASPYFSSFGVANLAVDLNQFTGYDVYGWSVYISNFGTPSQGSMHNSGGGGINSNALTAGDVIGVAYNSATGIMDVYQNGVIIGTHVWTGITGTVFPAFGSAVYNSTQFTANFGPSFAYTPPTGYTGLCTATPPTANAGADTTLVQPTSSLTIVGSGTDAVSQAWTQVSGPATITFTNGTTFIPTLSGLTVAGTYVVRLTVTGDGTATDDRTITVRAAPTVNGVINRNYSRRIIVPH